MATRPKTEPSVYFQKVGDPHLSRTDHIWFECNKGWKCCLCGGIIKAPQLPPPFPTRAGFVPDRIESLSEEERLLEPYHPR